MPTPPLPQWIRDFRHQPAFTNIYELCPDETRLYGTESLYDCWDGQLLLLAKDFAPSSLIHERRGAKDPRPYRHSPWDVRPILKGATTNRNLYKYAEQIRCGKLYGSAYAGLLRNDGKVSGHLANSTEIKQFVRRVLDFTVYNMPNLRVIACLGELAWDCAIAASDLVDRSWHEYRNARQTVGRSDGIKLVAMAHPSRYPGGKAQVDADWETLRRMLGREDMGRA